MQNNLGNLRENEKQISAPSAPSQVADVELFGQSKIKCTYY